MAQEIGAVLSRTFREFCNESNKRAKKDFSVIEDEEIQAVEKILKKADGKNFDLEQALFKFFGVEKE